MTKGNIFSSLLIFHYILSTVVAACLNQFSSVVTVFRYSAILLYSCRGGQRNDLHLVWFDILGHFLRVEYVHIARWLFTYHSKWGEDVLNVIIQSKIQLLKFPLQFIGYSLQSYFSMMHKIPLGCTCSQRWLTGADPGLSPCKTIEEWMAPHCWYHPIKVLYSSKKLQTALGYDIWLMHFTQKSA